jgi:hypothetical protein
MPIEILEGRRAALDPAGDCSLEGFAPKTHIQSGLTNNTLWNALSVQLLVMRGLLLIAGRYLVMRVRERDRMKEHKSGLLDRWGADSESVSPRRGSRQTSARRPSW